MNSLLNFHCRGTQINLLTKDDQLRVENVRRMKDIYEELPDYLQFKTKTDANNTDSITLDRWKNSYKTHVPQSSAKRAANTGRGLSTPIFQVDEPPFQPFIELAMPAALAGMGAARELAIKAEQPYGIILTTTAGKKDETSGRFIYNYCEAAAIWTENFYDAINSPDLETMVRKNSTGVKAPSGGKSSVYRVYGNFNHRQLGKTDDWVRRQVEELGATQDEVDRDYLGKWTSGTEHSPLPTHMVELLTKSIRSENFSVTTPQRYILRWYVQNVTHNAITKHSEIIIGIDTSDAVGGDDITFVGTDFRTGEVLVTATINETNLIHFAQFLVEFMVEYPKSFYIPERRSSAVTIIDYLLLMLPQKGINPFMRIFNWVMNDPDQHKSLYDEAKHSVKRHTPDLYVRAKRYFGFATSGSGQTSRDDLYTNTLQNAIRRCAKSVKDRKLTEQITGLTIKKGRIDHADGSNDDMVIAYLLSHWFMTMAKNLANYGFNPAEVLSKVEGEERNLTPRQSYEENAQKQLRARVMEIFDEIQKEKNSILVERLENEMRLIDKRLVLREGEQFNIDNVIEQMRQKRKTDLIKKFRGD
jgi:hypothetical protein